MNIGLIDVDSHNFPNLALMKISAHHKRLGDTVEWWNGLKHYDIVYMSKVFRFTPDIETVLDADRIIRGGTGYDLTIKLSREIESQYPDYDLYRIKDTAYGYLTRGCPRNCEFCIVTQKEGWKSKKVADLSEFWNGQKNIVLLDPNLLACKDCEHLLEQLADSGAWVDFTQGVDVRLIDKDIVTLLNRIKTKRIHFAWDDPEDRAVPNQLELFAKHSKIQDRRKRSVYILTNFDSTHEQDLKRVYKVKELGFDPYVMIYCKEDAPRETRLLQRWVNNKIIFGSCEKFEDYDSRKG